MDPAQGGVPTPNEPIAVTVFVEAGDEPTRSIRIRSPLTPASTAKVLAAAVSVALTKVKDGASKDEPLVQTVDGLTASQVAQAARFGGGR